VIPKTPTINGGGQIDQVRAAGLDIPCLPKVVGSSRAQDRRWSLFGKPIPSNGRYYKILRCVEEPDLTATQIRAPVNPLR
jgi:hypothetical protein